MSKSRTRKPASKPASKPSTSSRTAAKDDAAVAEAPMDPSVQEQTTPEVTVNKGRDAYAVQTLIAEVTALFPETSYETGSANSFGTRLSVDFDGNEPDLYPLLALIQSDVRVRSVDPVDGHTFVDFHRNLRTQDSRAPFGLVEAYAILSEESESAWAENDARLAPEFARDELDANIETRNADLDRAAFDAANAEVFGQPESSE